MMMVACGFFLMTDGLFSYAGFVAVEVVAISSTLAVLMMLDAVTVLKCRARKAEKNRNVKIKTSTDYESDEDVTSKRILAKGRKAIRTEHDEFGADEAADSDEGQRTRRGPASVADSMATSRVDDETRRQIVLLEELAKQMREEKEQLRLEKERIERERQRMLEDQTSQAQKMNAYLYDDSVGRSIDSRLEEGLTRSQARIARTIGEKASVTRRPYRDIEGEMEDYAQCDEDEFEEDSEGEVMELPALPRPAFAQINYFRQMDGDAQFWMQQVSPRAGGDSHMGQYDMDGTPEVAIRRKAEAVFDEAVSVPPTRQTAERYQYREDASQGVSNMHRDGAVSEFFQDRSEARIDLGSNHSDVRSEQEYFEKAEAAYSHVGYPEREMSAEYVGAKTPVYSVLDERISRDGSAREFFAKEDAAKGAGEKPVSRMSDAT